MSEVAESPAAGPGKGLSGEGPASELPRDLVARTVHLGRALREEGIPVGPGEVADAVRSLEAVGLGDREEVRLTLRSVLTCRRRDYGAFERLFRTLWCAPSESAPAPASPAPDGRSGPAPEPPPPSREPPGKRVLMTLDRWLGDDDAEIEGEPSPVPSVSPHHSRKRKDFSTYGDEEMEAMDRVARRIARTLARHRSRRWKSSTGGGRVHLRGTLRRSLSTGGEVVGLSYRERRPRKVRLVALCDVSGSMDLYSRFLLQFLYALQHALGRIETFAFSTRISRITGALREGSYREALDRLAEEVEGWSGGTRIGAALEAFEERWGRLVDRKTVVVILSDGWDTGEPEVLAGALRRIRDRARKVIWLNPLLGSPSYEPRTRGMVAALPHVDVFAPAHDLESLERLAMELVRR